MNTEKMSMACGGSKVQGKTCGQKESNKCGPYLPAWSETVRGWFSQFP